MEKHRESARECPADNVMIYTVFLRATMIIYLYIIFVLESLLVEFSSLEVHIIYTNRNFRKIGILSIYKWFSQTRELIIPIINSHIPIPISKPFLTLIK